MNIVETPGRNKFIFVATVIQMLFGDNDRHTSINSKYYDINELNAMSNKENYFGIFHLNTASLNKNIESLSNLLSMMEFNY